MIDEQTFGGLSPSPVGKIPALSALLAHAGSNEVVVAGRGRAFFGESVSSVKIFFFIYLDLSLRFDQLADAEAVPEALAAPEVEVAPSEGESKSVQS
jgi:hypothetical protein